MGVRTGLLVNVICYHRLRAESGKHTADVLLGGKQSKAVPLHAMVALWDRGSIATATATAMKSVACVVLLRKAAKR
jgi:hypothetical protein